MIYTQQEINNFYSKYSCCFASLATDYTNSLAIGAFDCGQKLDKLLQFKSYLDILYCYKVDTCIIDQPEVQAGISSWYFGIGSFTGTITLNLIIDGVETYIGEGTSVSEIVTSINNNTEGTGASALLGEGGYFTIYSPIGCFVKADLTGSKDPAGTIPATITTFLKGKCPQVETCVEYTEEELNCITNENLDTLLFWMKQQCLNIKNKPTITEVECVEVSENEFSISINDSITIEAGDSIEVSRNGNVYTITNPLPDLEVTIEAGNNIVVTGTYPNFTISSTGGGGGSSIWGGITGNIEDQTDLINYLVDNYYPLAGNPSGFLTDTSLMVDTDNATLLADVAGAVIVRGVKYRVLDATDGINQCSVIVIGRGNGSVSKAAYREGRYDGALIQVTGIYGSYDPVTNIFIEQGRIATAPTVNEDVTHGYYVGQELKTLDDGTVYVCSDATTGAAVWAIGGIPTLQQVTTSGATTTNGITVDNGTDSVIIQPNQLKIANAIGYGTIAATNLTADPNFELPDKPTGTYTFAMLTDITSGSIPHAVASGTDTYTATISGVTAYNDGDAYLIRFTNGNTANCTLDINSIGGATPPRLYRNNDGRLLGGDIWDGGEMLCIYNSTLGGFQCIGTSPNSLFAYITNAESIAITKGQVVYAFGGVGDRMTVKLANNTAEATSAKTIGVVVTSSIAANQKGIIITQGLLDTLSILPTATYADGDSIYLGATNGSITNVKPYAPNHLVYIGTVTTASNGSSGRMYVKIQNGYELDELHNVQAQSPTNKDTLYYDNTVSPPQWKTASIATISGLKAPIVSVGNGTAVTGTIAITICKTLALAANSRAVGDAAELFVQTTKTLINGTQFVRVYWNTSASLTGAILIASTGAAVAATLSQALIRHMGIEVANGGGNGTQIFQPVSGANNPYVQSTSAIVAVAINWASPGFIIVSIQNGSILDSSNCNLISLK